MELGTHRAERYNFAVRRSFLPVLALTALPAGVMAAPGPAPTDASGRRYVVAAIGDSLTDTRAGGGGYLAALRARCPESRFDAYGVGGQRTDHMRWRFSSDLWGRSTPWLDKPKYTHVIVLGGVNDLAATSLFDARIGRIQQNLSFMFRQARANGVTVVALTVPPFGRLRGVADRRLEATVRLNRWIVDEAAADHAVDINPLLSCGDPAVLCPRYRRFANDPIHWGKRGHEAVGQALHRAVFSDCR